MIEFLSLFLGLVIGVHEVEVAVSGNVARVEIRLDGKQLAVLDDEPWRVPSDFGTELHPGELQAIAFNAAGEELGRAQQWINIPNQRATAGIVTIQDDDGAITAVQLTWSSPEFHRPRRVTVRLDDREIKVRPPYRVDLAEVADGPVHILSAEFEFSPEVVIRRELAFGSEFKGDHDSRLTAVAVILEDLDELPPADAMKGWFFAGGASLKVVGVEKPDARVIIVQDPTTAHRLAEMEPELEHRRKKARRRSGRPRPLDTFGEDVGLRVMSPEPTTPERRERAALLFPIANKATPGAKGLVKAAMGRSAVSTLAGPLMMSDAVAVAGLRAAEGNVRRAVVALLGPQRQDGSRFEPEVARRFLEDLRVPLFIWDLSGPAADGPAGWGATLPVDNVDDLVRGARRIRYQLEEQRIVWIGGRHLPQDIELGPESRGIRLAQ